MPTMKETYMTRFEVADPATPVFARVLDEFYAGKRDEKTLNITAPKPRK